MSAVESAERSEATQWDGTGQSQGTLSPSLPDSPPGVPAGLGPHTCVAPASFLLWSSAQALCPVLEDGTVHMATETTVSLGITLSSFSQP